MTDATRAEQQGWIDSRDPRMPIRIGHVAKPCRGVWLAGDAAVLERPLRIGIVGSRQPRADALARARRIARDVAGVGCTVVSGLAIGIDGVAHRAALDAGGDTIAVVAGGLASIHPRRNRAMAREIAGSELGDGVRAGASPTARGAVVSEYGAGTEPTLAYRFQERNRIIAALSDYLVVVQARSGSGSMGTADAALELGVPIGIVPSAPDDACYTGSTRLIHEGADAVVDGHSLFRRLELHGLMQPGFAAAAGRGAVLDPDQAGGWIGGHDGAQLPLFDHPLASLVQVPRALEDLADLAGLTVRDARRMLVDLEDDGLVVHVADGSWLAADVAP